MDLDLTRFARKGTLTLLVCIGMGAAFFIPGLDRVHLFDWDEANFAEASREMIERGNYLQVTIDYRPFWEKPPLFFWLQALSMKLLGVNEFAARFVNACCGMLTLAAVFLIGRKVYTPLFGMLWALAFLGSFLPHVFFKSGVIDPVFNLLIFSGITLCAKGILTDARPARAGWFALAGVAIGLATLAKGPVALLIVALVLAVYWVSLRFKAPVRTLDAAAFLTAAGAVAFVFFGIETLSHGTGFIREFIAYQIRLLTTNDAGHGRPIYFHFFVILFGCFPASFFAAVSLFRRDGSTREQLLYNRTMVVLFWVVLILFSLVKTKTVLYSSLTYFPVTYLAALFLHSLITGKRSLKGPLFASLAVFAALLTLVITIFPVLVMHKEWIVPLVRDKFAAACLENPVHWSGYEFLLGLGYGCAVAISLLLFARKRPAAGTLGLFGSTAVCLLVFLFLVAPKIETYTQGGPVAFFKAHADEDVYVRSLFKSYMDLFYSRKKPTANPASHDREWLLRGPIDKPVYFVGKITQHPENDSTLNLVKLKSEYGFSYYRRDVPPTSPSSSSP